MVIGFDTESFLFQPGLPAPQIVCSSWAVDDTKRVTVGDDSRRFFTKFLERGDHLTAVNMAYDVGCVVAAWPELLPLVFEAGDAGLFHCSAIREALHDIARDMLFKDHVTGKSFAKGGDEEMGGRYSMAILMKRHFDEDISAEKEGDVWRFKYAHLYGVPLDQWPREAISYSELDAWRHLRIHNAQNGHKNLHDEPAQVRAAVAIQLMRMWGFRTDADYIAHLEREVDAAWDEARAFFTTKKIFRPDGSKDTKHLQSLVLAAYNGDPPKTPGGGIATDRDTLLESGDPVLEKLGTAGKNDKRKTTYLPALREGTKVPITPEFNVLVNTGRVSSDWQQMPQKGGIREAVVSRGYLEWLQTGTRSQNDTVISSCDYLGLELRTMAQRAINDPDVRFSKMAEYLNTNKDVHSYVGGFFLGMTLEEFEPRGKGDLKPYRDVAKMFNFGAAGGAGGFAIAYNAKVKDNIRLCLSLKRAERCGVEKVVGFIGGRQKRVCALCVQIAKELKEKWLRAWPEQGLLFQKAGRLTANGKKTDVTIFGSRRVRGKCGYTQWLNTPFQGAGGDGTKAAMWKITQRALTDRHSPLWGSHIVLNVHDELISEHPWDRRHEAAFEVARLMVEVMDGITPDVKNSVTPAIMRRMFKSADAAYDRSKVLKPYWQPGWKWGPDQEAMALDMAA
jgi:DNA polymerase-1